MNKGHKKYEARLLDSQPCRYNTSKRDPFRIFQSLHSNEKDVPSGRNLILGGLQFQNFPTLTE